MKKILALILALALIATLFVGCSKNNSADGTTENKAPAEPTGTHTTEQPTAEPVPANPLVGTWLWDYGEEGVAGVYIFNADGTAMLVGVDESVPCTYTVSGDTLTLSYAGESIPLSFSIDGDRLTMDDGEQLIVLIRSVRDVTPPDDMPAGTDPLLGTWKCERDGETVFITFNADGTGTEESGGYREGFTYTVSDGVIFVTEGHDTLPCPFSIHGNTMNMTVMDTDLVFDRAGVFDE